MEGNPWEGFVDESTRCQIKAPKSKINGLWPGGGVKTAMIRNSWRARGGGGKRSGI